MNVIQLGERKTMTISKRLMGLALIGFLATACSSTTLKGSWVKPDYTSKIENVYIIAIAKDGDFRMLFEEAFKRQLSGQGILVVTSHNNLPKDQEDNRERIIQAMNANGCDSVLLTKLDRKRKDEGTMGPEIKVVQVTPIPLYQDPLYNNWGDYYYQSYGVVNIQPTTPGAVTFTLESVLYDLKTEERIWSAQLEIVEEIDIKKMIEDYVNAVTGNLKGQGLI